ncbi:ABC transporter substrate-binding protein [Aureimonas populi]|uniref:ABC transporter substrate-binding protein n=1 Tax=Aureimonas populi TaxID=1701758 RepID=A0ABW5CKP1_9HYPH|nr:ABC transporter substrate-binding protein [Aureimonas populi]
MSGSLTRRGVLAAAAGALMPWPARARARRVAIVDWALLETMLALGEAPMAAVELVLFRQLAVEPAVPQGVVDLGLRGSMNLELLASLAPEVVYGSNYSAWAHELIERIAPVRSLSIYERGQSPFPKAEAAMRALGADLGLEGRAADTIAQTRAEIAARGRASARHRSRPLFVINIGDPRHFRAFGGDSMFGDVIAMMGFENAWGPQTSYSASAPVGIEALARAPEATVVIIGPVPPDARRVLPQSALWRAMPAVKAGRVVTLDTVNPFGALPAARRFARLLEAGLEPLAA